MSKLPWFKLYTEILHDPKMRRLTVEEKWFWVVLLCLASENEQRGVVSVTKALRYDVTDFAHVCGFTQNDCNDVITNALQKFVQLEMVSMDDIGIITIKNFEKRQDTLLTPAERMRRHRAKKKVTVASWSRNDDVTIVTLDKEEDRDKEKKNTPPTPSRGSGGVKERFEEFWESWPRHRRRSKGAAEKAYVRINPSEQLHDVILKSLERAKTSADWTKDNGQFVPYPATWLNAKGWEDCYDLPQEPKRLVPIFQPKPAEKIEPPPGILADIRKLSQGIFKEVSQ